MRILVSLLVYALVYTPVVYSFELPEKSTLLEDFTLEQEEASGELTLIAGEATVISVKSPQRASVVNPEIADIVKISDKEVIVVGKKVGDTALIIWDKEGKRVYNVSVFTEDLERLQKKVEKLITKDLKIGGITIKKNESTSKLMLIGEVALLEKEQIDKVIQPFAEKIDNLLTVKKESKLIEIEARILELSKTELDKIGVKWMEHLQIRQEPYQAPATTTTTGVQTTLNVIKPWTAVWGMAFWSRDALHARIDMLIRDGKGRELSRPKLLCLSGEEAKLIVGGEVPYLSGSTTGVAGTSISIQYREYGVILTMRPTALSGNKIFTSLKAEVSELDWENAIIVSSIRVPAFTKREATTVLNLNSDDTIFIAGLIKNKESEGVDKLPALGNVPILGALFRSKEFRNNETELVISLTPRLVQQKEPHKEEEAKGQPIENLRGYGGTQTPQLQEYIARVQRTILESISYPTELLHSGWEGVVVLKINILNSGEVRQVKVERSSGYTIFDEEAVRHVKSLVLSPFPQGIYLEELEITIPIVYRDRSS